MINGTKAIFYRVDSPNRAIVGQIEITNSDDSTPIDISSKSDQGWRKLLNGELASAGNTVTANIIYNSDAEYRALRQAVMDGAITQYVIDYTGIAADEVEFNAVPMAMSDSIPMGDKVTTSVTFMTTGARL